MKTYAFTIRQKLIFSFVFAVIVSTSLVSGISLRQSHQVIEQRILNSELPAILMQFNNSIDKEIAILLAAAKQMAGSQLLVDQVDAPLTPEQDRIILTEMRAIKQQYQLLDASVANRDSGKYWMDSFTTAAQHKTQGWFRTLVNSGQETSLSIYKEDNGDVKLFINYQQPNGVILAGLSKSMDSMVNFINQFKLEQTGFVYLVDSQGQIRLHKGKQDMRDATLAREYSPAVSQTLLRKADFNVSKITRDGKVRIIASSYIPSMDWFVVGELPEQEAFTELDSITQTIILWTVVIVAVFVLLAVIIAANITRPIHRLAAVFRDLGQGEGDLRYRLPIDGQDEMAQLSEGFNGFISKIHHTVKEVADTGNTLRHAAETVASQAEITLNTSHSQRDRTLQLVTAINQMGATVNEIAHNAGLAAESANSAESETGSGQHVVGQARDTINQLSDDISQVNQVVESLANNTQAIGSILDVIRAISEQTNLLALNAAIEAARAGEQGRGFAVVADEVRNLASRTAASTDEIQTMINRLQEEASNAVTAMVQSRQLTANGVSAADEASQALQVIAEKISLISEMNMQVAAATEEQSTVVNDINSNIDEINDSTQHTADTADQLAQSSQSLRTLSQRLDEMVGTFKL